ncbi:MAG: hypothetical protein ABR936_10110 [Bacteroidota bacterium]|jgi:hypothetical protein
MKNILSILIFLLCAIILCDGCTDRYPIGPFLDSQNNSYLVGDTSYLEIYPPFQLGFNGPAAVLVGNDQLLYVADTRNNRVVLMDIAGGFLGSCHIDQPISLAQDFRLDLLVGGTVSKHGNAVGALFRIHLVQALHHLDSAKVDTVWTESAHPQRRFVGIATLPNNQYLAARTGPDNSSGVDPDTRVMIFDVTDEYLTPITDLITGTGSGINYINHLTGIAALPNSRNFIVLQKGYPEMAYGALWMLYSQSSDFEGWQPKFDPSSPKDALVDFIRRRLISPGGVAIDGKRLDVFITDAVQDSVFKFNSKGIFKAASFGRYWTNNRMKSPTGAAFFDKTLYIADSTANCIFRFKLSTDFQ